MVNNDNFGDEMEPEKNRPPFHFDAKLEKAADKVKKILEEEEVRREDARGQVCTAGL